ncbi:AAA family ATPase [Nocardioides pantholopis]|uniref:AAA family ATPase n=1 Tax=Nocardioides pantholopis TaxID=2483798 RepID=UPI000FDA5D5B|nr:SMC family ATPase [Nocardioides pantholopis]
MRLHSLDVTAFGPFADTVSVDFDQLSDAGLFLLSGPTGAGKTSVLDAVCFALYGDVPGDRSGARRLRSDHAAPGVAPRVVLEATLAGRRFRLTRSPAWERPKKRGSGTTTEQASVVLAERIGGEWQTLSTRLDETGHQVAALVGMNLTQFTQVAMLPQGRFQSFLRARSEQRHQLLQQLFRTGRFESVERWLREHRTSLRRSSETAHQAVADLVSRVSEATEVPLPETWDVYDLTVPATDGALLSWATGLREDAVAGRARTQREAAAAAEAETGARRAVEQARALIERRARLDAAAAEVAALDAAAAEHTEQVEALACARRAAPVVPLWRLQQRSAARCSAAAAAADRAVAAAGAELGLLVLATADDVDPAELAAGEREAVADAARVRAAVPEQTRLGELTARLDSVADRRRSLVEARAELTARAAALPARLQGLRVELEAATTARAALPALDAEVAALDGRLEAQRDAAALERDLDAARAGLVAATADVAALREHWLDVREARLEGMAAEIAGALAVGSCCPVCGSADHPQKAVPGPDAPDADAERRAQRRLDDAKATELAHAEHVRELETRLALSRDRSGPLTAQETAALRDEAAVRLATARETAARATSLQEAAAAAESEQARLGDRLSALDAQDAALAAEHDACGRDADRVRAGVDALLAGTGHRDLDALAAAHEERAGLLRAALQAVTELGTARQAAADAARGLAEGVAEAGFDTVEDALAVVLDDSGCRELADRVSAHDRRRAAAEAVLAEPGAPEVAAASLPDVPVLTAQHEAALDALGAARSRAGVWGAREQRLTALVEQLAAALEEWGPLRADLELATRVCSFAEGKSPDNRLQMRLSAYVLAYRLAQVVAAANERLSRMSDQRYSLEHTGRRGAGETRGGLSLLVRDDWSGESRDPATLSGGETFVVSLALALGLADVITQEAGGADLDTLFVDEGFGSLDADTLDDVMDTLDSLRDGGRVVGVVSHVAEMRDRIPTRLVVTKGRTGSTLAVSR